MSLVRAGPLAWDSADGVCGNGRPTLTLGEFPTLLFGCDEAGGAGEAKDGAVLPWENLKVDGVKEDAMRVSSSDMLVEPECLKPFLRDRIGCGVRARLASNFAMVLATWLTFET